MKKHFYFFALFLTATILSYGQANIKLSNLASPTAINQNLQPKSDNTLNLGSANKGWKILYLRNSLYLKDSLFLHNKGTQNTFVGLQAGNAITTGSYNTAGGYRSLHSNTTGNYNTAFGRLSLFSNDTGVQNTAFGESSLYSNKGGNVNLAIGQSSLYRNTTGAFNSGLGFETLFNSNGSYNTASGAYGLFNNTTGNNNVVNGYNAGRNSTAGNNNVFMGWQAGFNNTTGSNNIYIGYNAGGAASLSNTVAIGANTTATQSNTIILGTNQNVGIGTTNPAYKLGVNGTVYGYSATNGIYGYSTGGTGTYGVYGASINGEGVRGFSSANYGVQGISTDGKGVYGSSINSYGVWGNSSQNYGVYAASTNKSGLYATSTNQNGIEAYSDVGYGINCVGNLYEGLNARSISGQFAASIQGAIFASEYDGPSDQNLKRNVQDFDNATDIIKQLKPKKYEYRHDGDYKIMNFPQGIRYGLIAQDVEQILPNLVRDKKVKIVDSQTDSGQTPKNSVMQFKTLNYIEFIPILIKSMQELSFQNDSLKQELNKTVAILNNRIDKLEALIKQSNNFSNDNSSANYSQSFTKNTSATSLGQNVPNPFKNTTTIQYNIATNFKSAFIVFTNLNGVAVKQIQLKGVSKGTIEISTSLFSSGAYNYSLVIDGGIIDTKKMIVGK